MPRTHESVQVDALLLDDLSHLVRLAIREDLDRGVDLTTISTVPESLNAQADIVARVPGMAAGFAVLESIVRDLDAPIECKIYQQDGQAFEKGDVLATISGPARDLLTCERTILNFLGRLCGIATWTARHVEKISGTGAELNDTRKTTPGWRRLEKYAVRCGGGTNHRTGLFDAVLIKDNHLACRAHESGRKLTPREAVEHARAFLKEYGSPENTVVQIEVDTLEQLLSALQANPDIILLDNMDCCTLEKAVAYRNDGFDGVLLEASGGVNLDTIGAIAHTGVDRISVGALTHSATNLDLGLDWRLGNDR
jgi:nicotinate-nucleotide pyrophosphorylase (carboxylating)